MLGVYLWEESGKRANYLNWASGDPDGGTSQNCISKTDPGWIDATCFWDKYANFYGEPHALCQMRK